MVRHDLAKGAYIDTSTDNINFFVELAKASTHKVWTEASASAAKSLLLGNKQPYLALTAEKQGGQLNIWIPSKKYITDTTRLLADADFASYSEGERALFCGLVLKQRRATNGAALPDIPILVVENYLPAVELLAQVEDTTIKKIGRRLNTKFYMVGEALNLAVIYPNNNANRRNYIPLLPRGLGHPQPGLLALVKNRVHQEANNFMPPLPVNDRGNYITLPRGVGPPLGASTRVNRVRQEGRDSMPPLPALGNSPNSLAVPRLPPIFPDYNEYLRQQQQQQQQTHQSTANQRPCSTLGASNGNSSTQDEEVPIAVGEDQQQHHGFSEAGGRVGDCERREETVEQLLQHTMEMRAILLQFKVETTRDQATTATTTVTLEKNNDNLMQDQTAPADTSRSKKTQRSKRELSNLKASSNVGIMAHGVIPDHPCLFGSRQLRSKSKLDEVEYVPWHKATSVDSTAQRPIVFRGNWKDFQDDMWKVVDKVTKGEDYNVTNFFDSQGLDVVQNGVYFKGHLKNEYLLKYLGAGQLPLGYKVKNVEQKAIVFINKKTSQCVTHYDRDTSILLLLSGKKEFFLAKRNEKVLSGLEDESNSTLFPKIDPFASGSEKGSAEGLNWHKVTLYPTDALLVPQNWVHCVKSYEDTIAVSVQVQRFDSEKQKSPAQKKARASKYANIEVVQV